MTKIVECIPNFSEARRTEVVASIINSILSSGGISILDRHSDMDHNRSVITFIGTPEKVEEAAFRGIETACRLINLDLHHGEHPRLGAADVVPFVPINDVSMEECVCMAAHLGERVGKVLGIPVYLYEEAATREDRRSLENIRRGQYELLKKEIGSNPDRDPDFGPQKLGPAGATIIGARQFLIAFNVYLDTADISIARSIAKKVRFSSGGYKGVKAIGLLVNGLAQVSMNLTDYHQTSPSRIVEAIRSEAAQYGTVIHHSELVGLVPLEAIIDSAGANLHLQDLSPHQVLEKRIYDEIGSLNSTDSHPDEFLARLASLESVPAAGSAAAHTGAAAASLVVKIASLTMNNEKYDSVKEKMGAILDRANVLRQKLIDLVELDSSAYIEVIIAKRRVKEASLHQGELKDLVQKKTLAAVAVPLQTAEMSAEIASLAGKVVEMGLLSAITDAANAASLAVAACRSASLTARANLSQIGGTPQADAYFSGLQVLETQISSFLPGMEKTLKERSGLQYKL